MDRKGNKLAQLKNILIKLESVIAAFSGGVDSSFLLKAAIDVLPKSNVLAVTAVSDTYTKSELKQAKKFAKTLGVYHNIIYTNELDNQCFTSNPIDRCYYCKKELFVTLSNMAKDKGFNAVIDASNLDDIKDYRPGSLAKKEFGVRSPLQEAKITKSDIRRFSKQMRLETWDSPSMACLASRIPYGIRIEKDVLRRIEKAEAFIRSLGFKQVRVRCHNDTARIEIERKDIKKVVRNRFCDKINSHLKKIGFRYIVLDLEGYRTGSMNEVLEISAA